MWKGQALEYVSKYFELRIQAPDLKRGGARVSVRSVGCPTMFTSRSGIVTMPVGLLYSTRPVAVALISPLLRRPA